MKRTTLMLPRDLRERAGRRAQKLGISLGEFVRRSLRAALERADGNESDDLLLADGALFRGSTPRDLAADHDGHLYGGER